MGDGLFIHEYHLSQMAFVLVYPIMKIYLWLVGSTEGILLAFRYIFTGLHGLTAIFLYWRLRKRNTGAFFISLIYLLFTPFGIMALCYNSMGIALMCISATLIYSNERNSRGIALIAGVAFSGAVLCCPFLLLVYLYYAVVAVLISRRHKSFLTPTMKCFIYFTTACVVCAVVFVLFVFSRCSVSQLLEAIPGIFNDPSHPGRSIRELFYSYIASIGRSNMWASTVFPLAILMAGAAVLLRKYKLCIMVFLFSGVGLTAAYLIPFITTDCYLNFLAFPMVILGGFCFALFPKENLREFLMYYIPGLLYGICIHCSSNQRFYVISDAALLSTIGTILMLTNVQKKLSVDVKGIVAQLFRVAAIVLVTVLTLSVFSLRMNLTFWDARMSDRVMTEQIEVGANKGIFTDKNKKEMYTYWYNETEDVRNYPGEQVLYISMNTWFYLDDTKKNASFSAWMSGVSDQSSDRLVRYYEINPDKLPDIVHCDRENFKSDYSVVQYFLSLGYTTIENDSSVLIVKQQECS